MPAVTVDNPLALPRVPQPSPTDAARPGFVLQDVTTQAGIRFVHHRPTLDPKLARTMEPRAATPAYVRRPRTRLRANCSATQASNPIPIVIPCHRVVGSSGALTGYAGGVDRKRALLELEGVDVRL